MIFFVLQCRDGDWQRNLENYLGTNRPHFQAPSHFPPLSSSKEIRQRPWLDLDQILSTGWLHTKKLSRGEWSWTVVFSKWRCVQKGLRSAPCRCCGSRCRSRWGILRLLIIHGSRGWYLNFGTWKHLEECFSLFVNLDTVPKNLTPGKFTYIWLFIRVE